MNQNVIRRLSKRLNNSHTKYIISGISAFLAEYVTFIGLYYLIHKNLIVINALSFIIGLTVSFTLNKKWVFHGDHVTRSEVQLISYFLLACLNLLVSTLLISLLLSLGIYEYMSKFIAIIFIAIWNFYIFKTIIFKKK